MSFSNTDRKRIVVAMSGGVDSSVAALLLKNRGHEVTGFTGIMHEPAEEAARKAKSVCDVLGIEHRILDLKDYFRKNVIKYFEDSYKQGLTPNPCTYCNRIVKWGEMGKFVFDEIQADYYATGHYAKILKQDNSYRLYRANYLKKDQTYMLFALNQEDLSRTLFPLGEMEKSQTREIARQANLPIAESPESQDVCFICPPDTTQSYLINKFGEQEGDIVDYKTGKILGKHKGSFNYTIGQRKGICVSAPQPLYVIKTGTEENKVYVGYKDLLYSKEFTVGEVNWQQETLREKESFPVMARVRYNSQAQKATVTNLEDKRVKVMLDEPKDAITPGQAAVFYDLNNEYILGGGWIE